MKEVNNKYRDKQLTSTREKQVRENEQEKSEEQTSDLNK